VSVEGCKVVVDELVCHGNWEEYVEALTLVA
jgi:hypothetical protein